MRRPRRRAMPAPKVAPRHEPPPTASQPPQASQTPPRGISGPNRGTPDLSALISEARASLARRSRLARPRAPSEHAEQCQLAAWVRAHLAIYPALENWTAVPNAEQSKAQAGKKWAEGVRRGYPDTLLDVPLAGWHGLRIELKRAAYWSERRGGPTKAGEPSEDQVGWHRRLTRAGYLVWVTWGWEPARDILLWYLNSATPATLLPEIARARVYTLSHSEVSP
jgi:hypothetical protein